MDIIETLIGITQIATALTGFTGIVTAFGSQQQHSWHSGDRLRLRFLLEASLTAAAFSLLALLVLSIAGEQAISWSVLSTIWIIATLVSLIRARRLLHEQSIATRSVDKLGNNLTTFSFLVVLGLQIINIFVWQQFAPFFGAILLNLAGAAMQFGRLIQSVFRSQPKTEQNLQTICRYKPDHLQAWTSVPLHNSYMPSSSGKH